MDFSDALSEVSIYTDAVEFDLTNLETEDVLPVGINLGGNVYVTSFKHDWIQRDPKVDLMYSKEELTISELQKQCDHFDQVIDQVSFECEELERRNEVYEEELRYLLDRHLKRHPEEPS